MAILFDRNVYFKMFSFWSILIQRLCACVCVCVCVCVRLLIRSLSLFWICFKAFNLLSVHLGSDENRIQSMNECSESLGWKSNIYIVNARLAGSFGLFDLCIYLEFFIQESWARTWVTGYLRKKVELVQTKRIQFQKSNPSYSYLVKTIVLDIISFQKLSHFQQHAIELLI